jgi:invasion protein IalB
MVCGAAAPRDSARVEAGVNIVSGTGWSVHGKSKGDFAKSAHGMSGRAASAMHGREHMIVREERMMRRFAGIAIAVALAGISGTAEAATAVKKPVPKPAVAEGQHNAEAAAPPAAAQAGAKGWATRCSAAARQAPLECVIEESVVMNGTGQLVVGVTIRVPNDTRSPVLLIHLPLGLYLPAGVKLQVDAAEPVGLALQTCDGSGCFSPARPSPPVFSTSSSTASSSRSPSRTCSTPT